jgi:hypothetical protein
MKSGTAIDSVGVGIDAPRLVTERVGGTSASIRRGTARREPTIGQGTASRIRTAASGCAALERPLRLSLQFSRDPGTEVMSSRGTTRDLLSFARGSLCVTHARSLGVARDDDSPNASHRSECAPLSPLMPSLRSASASHRLRAVVQSPCPAQHQPLPQQQLRPPV